MKLCKTCLITKPVTDFYKVKDGFFPECKRCSINRTKKWQSKNPEDVKRLKRENYHRHRISKIQKGKINYNKREYGGNRETVIQRDNQSCRRCGLTREDHLTKWNEDITVDHISRDRSDNSLDNLQTLCLSCHGKKDNGGMEIGNWARGRAKTPEDKLKRSIAMKKYWANKKNLTGF